MEIQYRIKSSNLKRNIMSRIFPTILLILLIAICVTLNGQAQTLSPSVIGSGGAYLSSGNASLSYTIGETNTQTLSSVSNKLTQGFQQPEVQIKTGTVPTSLCPGGNVTIPYIADGIIGSTNVFTAQLSNATGSFSSPVSIGSFTGNISGNINGVIPPGTAQGTAYRIRVVSSLPSFTGPDNGTNISIVNSCSITLNLQLFLEGYYDGSGTMKPVLMNQGVGNNTSVTDSIDVELHGNVAPFATASSTRVLLNTNGMSTCSFPVSAGNYYIVVKHRNTVQTWSATPVFIGTLPVSYNFSSANGQAYGGNLIEVETGVWALYTGDITQDENVDLLDLGNLETEITNFAFGYEPSDLNGDGNVDLLDSPMLETNVNSFVFSSHP